MIARRLPYLAVVFVGLAAAAPLVAETSATNAVTPPTKEKKICRGEANSTSRIAKKRTCKTRAEWAAQDNADAARPDDKSLRNLPHNH